MSKLMKIALGFLVASLVLAIVLALPRAVERNTGRPAPAQRNESKKNGGSREAKTTIVAEGLEIPWSLVFLPDRSALFTERPGRVRFMDRAGNVRAEPIAGIQVVNEGEGGLLGITLHPDFSQNKQIYLYSTYARGSRTLNRVQRYRFNEEKLTLEDKTTIIDKIPGGAVHNGGRLKFGPDEKLYVATGETGEPELAQNRNSLAGKILRLNDDGSVPTDNPFAGSPVYALGLRNPQGLAWEPGTGRLYSTQHGPDANDELNLIEAGKNYGWPDVIGEGRRPGFEDPILASGQETWAPSGMAFYSGPNDEFKDNLFFAALRGEHLQRVILAADGGVKSTEELFAGRFGRLRDVVSGPGGALYLLTSNRDGRGSPVPSDDRIIKVVF